MEDEHVKGSEAAPRTLQDLRGPEALLEREHPVEAVHGEREVVLDAEAEEDVLQGRAASLVRLGECDLRGKHSLVMLMQQHTRSMVRVGQSEWDDIKILGHQMGHLISKFQAIWDTSLTCQVKYQIT